VNINLAKPPAAIHVANNSDVASAKYPATAIPIDEALVKSLILFNSSLEPGINLPMTA